MKERYLDVYFSNYISNDVCSSRENSIMCKVKGYVDYLVETVNEFFNTCSIPFIAFGLRLLIELITLCIYIDLHHVYGKMDLNRKSKLIQSFNLSKVVTRSTFFRRLTIDILGPDEGRKLLDQIKNIYKNLSKYLHTPLTQCLTSTSSNNLCQCTEDLDNLKSIAKDVNNTIRRLALMWFTLGKD